MKGSFEVLLGAYIGASIESSSGLHKGEIRALQQLHEAALAGNYQLARESLEYLGESSAFLEFDFLPSLTDGKIKASAFELAASTDRPGMLKLLLEEGAYVHTYDIYLQQRLLHKMVIARREEAARLLIENGANINAEDGYDMTPLHYAAAQGHRGLTELLIDKKADINACNDFNITPLHYAVMGGHNEVAELLIVAGAKVNAKDKYRATPLHYAAWLGQTESAQLLVERGVDPGLLDKGGATALERASQRGHTAVVKLLQKSESENE